MIRYPLSLEERKVAEPRGMRTAFVLLPVVLDFVYVPFGFRSPQTHMYDIYNAGLYPGMHVGFLHYSAIYRPAYATYLFQDTQIR